MHTMFVRLHNRVALELRRLNTHWDSDQVYQESKMIVGAIHQKINYLEYLPLIIGGAINQSKFNWTKLRRKIKNFKFHLRVTMILLMPPYQMYFPRPPFVLVMPPFDHNYSA